MNLLEYQAKRQLEKYGFSVPNGVLISEASQTDQVTSQIKPPYAVKAQVSAGGRGKAGGIKFAGSTRELQDALAQLFRAEIKGLPVKQVLVEEKISIRRELYTAVTIDRLNRGYVLLVSASGGVDIEEVADKTPEAILKTPLTPEIGLSSLQAEAAAKQLGYSGSQLARLSATLQALCKVCLENDAELVEVNPLVENDGGAFIAVDARTVIDDNALFRHPEYAVQVNQALSSEEVLAAENGLAYVKLDGDIGVVGNGAGLVLATLDLINFLGGKPADFLDLGGGAGVEAVSAALKLVLADSKVKVVLVNVIGGITRCDDVARGIVQSSDEAAVRKPIVVRLVGANQEEGQRILSEAGILVLGSMEEAAKQAIETVRGAES